MNDNENLTQISSRLNPDKLFVEFRTGITPISPILCRHYTLTHSDITADLLLTVALQYARDKINEMRDEVLAQWCVYENQYYLIGQVYVDGKFSSDNSAIRNRIFRRELPLALEAIYYGDRAFFHHHPALKYAPIWIYFNSTNPQYNKVEYWGVPANY